MAEGNKNTVLWVVLGIGGALLLVCGGAVVAGVMWIGGQVEEIEKLGALPPEEREAALAEKFGISDADHAPTIDAFLTALDEGRIDEAHGMMSSGVTSGVSIDELTRLQETIESALGGYRSRRIRNIDMRTGFGSTAEEYIEYRYAADYERGTATLTLRLTERPDGTDAIHHYQVNSPLLLDAMGGGTDVRDQVVELPPNDDTPPNAPREDELPPSVEDD